MAKDTKENTLEELTLESLNKSFEALKAETAKAVSDLSKSVDTHIDTATKTADAHAGEIAGLKKTTTDLSAAVVQQDTALKSAGKAINELKIAKPVEKDTKKKEEKPVVPTGTFTVLGVTAKFAVPAMRAGGKIVPTAVVLENQADYQAELEKLVKTKSALIKIVA